MKSRRGLRQHREGEAREDLYKPADPTKESLEEPGLTGKKFRPMHQASRVQEVPPTASPEGGEDRRPSIPGRNRSAEAEDRSRQPEGQRVQQPPAEAGWNTLRCLQLRSDQQWEEEIPLELPRKIPRKNERNSLAGEQSEQRTKRGPQVART